MLVGGGLHFGPPLDRDFPSIPPPLYGRVTVMLQLAGHLSDAPKAANYGQMGFHSPLVRCGRTRVKLDNVRRFGSDGGMASRETIGQKLIEMRSRSGMSLESVAQAGGWKGRSSVQRFFSADYDPEWLPWEVAQGLLRAFDGKLPAPDYVKDLFALAGVPLNVIGEQFSVKNRIGSLGDLPRDIPVYGTALGAEISFDRSDGSGVISVEQAELDLSEVIGHLRRPPALEGRKTVYGVYVSGASMFPRFGDGEAVIVDPKRPPMVGDDVIIQLASPDAHDGDRVSAVLVKRLVRRTAAFLELEQFNPALSFRIPVSQVKSCHRIVPSGELLS